MKKHVKVLMELRPSRSENAPIPTPALTITTENSESGDRNLRIKQKRIHPEMEKSSGVSINADVSISFCMQRAWIHWRLKTQSGASLSTGRLHNGRKAGK